MKHIYTILLIFLSFRLSYGQTNAVEPSKVGGVYQVGTLAELSWVIQNSSSWSGSFEQTIDIDASETATWDDVDGNSDGDLYNDPDD